MDNQPFSYDRLAKHYDFLSRLVFSKSQVRAQTEQLVYIKNCKELLIVGGGTGWILEALNAFDTPISITFVETSAKMIALAKKIETHHHMKFMHQDIENFGTHQQFDAVLTPFLFDNFNEDKAKKVFEHITSMLIENAFWLYTDFKLDGKLWKKYLLKIMHLFFQLIRVVKVDSLPKMNDHFNHSRFLLVNEKYYYRGFIEAKVYQKSNL